eukprot:TRINITY_DN12658_c0_g3_i10.p2 TRINITY_DN12658_c0_g3~~TRINITY_DN12658_c0_g3_i10.p2  ORF type:complete len:280 (-),score=79.15 TRINITY_DN12658_c0_g3_i10:1405-2244(-)
MLTCSTVSPLQGVDHVTTHVMQSHLLRVALCLGVDIDFGLSAQAVLSAPARLECVEDATRTVREFAFDSLLVASGATNNLLYKQQHAADEPLVEYNESGQSQVFGFVVHFEQHQTPEEAVAKDFSYASQYKKQFFADLYNATGVHFENLVKYHEQNGDTHYVVGTPKKRDLLDAGIFKVHHSDTNQLLRRDNINQDRLAAFAESLRDYLGLPQQCKIAQHAGGAALFDFSRRRSATKAVRVVPGADNYTNSTVFVVGDSLIEPCKRLGAIPSYSHSSSI